MVRPERRTQADLVAVALIAVAILAGVTVLWQFSDARATVSERAPKAREPSSATAVPATLDVAWQAPSPATPVPAVAGPSIITGAGGEVLGRDPASGQIRWRYARDIPLCTVGTAWGQAIAVHRKAHHCSEVTALEGTTGERGPQRNSDAELGTQLLSDGTYVTTSGNTVESWRSDLVRTQQYGVPKALRNPDNNLPRPECRRASVGVGDDLVSVIEKCPRDSLDRLTVIKAKPEDDEEPEEVFSNGIGSTNAGIVAVNQTRTAVVLRDQHKLEVYDAQGDSVGQFDLPPTTGDEAVLPKAPEQLRTVRLDPKQTKDLPKVAKSMATALREVQPGITEQSILTMAAGGPTRVAALQEDDHERVEDALDGLPGVSFGSILYWHTGTATVALDATSLTPLWNIPDTLGPGALFGGKLLVPVRAGLAVVNPGTGVPQRTIPVDRKDYAGPVQLDSVGDVVLEQRGDQLVALR